MTKIKPRKLGHLVLWVRDIHKSVEFYTEILGLEVSDWIEEGMVFLRCSEDHHDLGLAQIPKDAEHFNDIPAHPRPGVEHFSYMLENLEEMENATKMLQEKGVEIVRGIGKHGPGENLFIVFKDPDGNNVEFYADMVQITDSHPYIPSVWENTIDAFDRWHFKKFVVTPPTDWAPDS